MLYHTYSAADLVREDRIAAAGANDDETMKDYDEDLF